MLFDFTKMFSGKTVVLLGAGVSNMPLAERLTAAGAHLVVRDKKTEEALGKAGEKLRAMGATLLLGETYLDGLCGDYIFRSPGFRPDMPQLLAAAASGSRIVSEMELFIRHAPCSVIGVTGSDGKSTTTTLIAKILEAEQLQNRQVFLGGNIGEPLLHRIDQMNSTDAVAAELSSFQLMSVDTPVSVAVIKNITPNHLNWHTDMAEYIAAKQRILIGCGAAVLNYDDSICRRLGADCTAPTVWFSRSPIPAEFLQGQAGGIYPKDGQVTVYDSAAGCEIALFPCADILLPGAHNLENYCTAIGAVWALARFVAKRENTDALGAAACKIAKEFGGVPHRLELVRVKDSVKFYNSSIDSSPTRTAAAISALDCPIRIICGGYDKKIPFESLAEALIGHGKIKTVVLTGAVLEKIKAALLENPDFAASGIQLLCEPDFDTAVCSAAQCAQPGDAVLLSPACASFDAFPNFEKRGERFRQLAATL